MKRQPLPENYHLVIAEMNGRFYPLRTDGDSTAKQVHLIFYPQIRWDFIHEWLNPPAIGTQPAQGIVSFRTYQQAADFCHVYADWNVSEWEWTRLAAQSELYPERTAWYCDEISSLAGCRPYVADDELADSAYSSVFLTDGTYCAVYAQTIDESIEQLYDQVYQYCVRKLVDPVVEIAN